MGCGPHCGVHVACTVCGQNCRRYLEGLSPLQFPTLCALLVKGGNEGVNSSPNINTWTQEELVGFSPLMNRKVESPHLLLQYPIVLAESREVGNSLELQNASPAPCGCVLGIRLMGRSQI